ncbi:hypothetical protein GCM10027053_18570 [Intrasporangium mesophilum]
MSPGCTAVGLAVGLAAGHPRWDMPPGSLAQEQPPRAKVATANVADARLATVGIALLNLITPTKPTMCAPNLALCGDAWCRSACPDIGYVRKSDASASATMNAWARIMTG